MECPMSVSHRIRARDLRLVRLLERWARLLVRKVWHSKVKQNSIKSMRRCKRITKIQNPQSRGKTRRVGLAVGRRVAAHLESMLRSQATRSSARSVHSSMTGRSRYLAFCSAGTPSAKPASVSFAAKELTWCASSAQTAASTRKSSRSAAFPRTNTFSKESPKCSRWIYSRRMRRPSDSALRAKV